MKGNIHHSIRPREMTKIRNPLIFVPEDISVVNTNTHCCSIFLGILGRNETLSEVILGRIELGMRATTHIKQFGTLSIKCQSLVVRTNT